jgi:hypothetical protein
MSASNEVNQQQINTLAADYQSLRSVKGHFAGGDDFIKDVDGFNGKKHM